MQAKKRKQFAMAVGAALLLVWIFFSEPTPPGVTPEARHVLGNRTVSVLAGADRVQVFRVSPRRDFTASQNIDGFPITKIGNEQGQEFAQRLSQTILQQNYENDDELACNTVTTVAFRVWNDNRPGLGMRIWRGRDYTDILLCYRCSEYSVAGRNAYGPFTFPVTTPFKPFTMRPELVRLAREAFPHDRDIQILEENE